MNDSVAHRLWETARQTGGSIMLEDVSEADIAEGRANGWLTSSSVGQFAPTEELRKVAAYPSKVARSA